MSTTPEVELPTPPTDGISSVTFSGSDAAKLLVTSWDKSVSLYDVSQPTLCHRFATSAAVLDGCFAGSDASRAYTGGLDRAVTGWDWETQTEVTVGTHDAPVRRVRYSDAYGVVVAGSWDKTVGLWDPRSAAVTPVARLNMSTSQREPLGSSDASVAATLWPTRTPPSVDSSVLDTAACLGRFEQPDRVFAMDIIGHTLVVATAGRHVLLYDIRKMDQAWQRRESSLKYMTRDVRCMPNGQGYVISSIEGRVAVEYFDADAAVQTKKYAFKCHRQVVQSVDVVYPVNAVAFHPIHGTFATGGSDGVVNIWDGLNKKRLRQYAKYPSSIASLAFSANGQWLAVASSYTFDEGEKERAPEAIYLRTLGENEARPKTVAAPSTSTA